MIYVVNWELCWGWEQNSRNRAKKDICPYPSLGCLQMSWKEAEGVTEIKYTKCAWETGFVGLRYPDFLHWTPKPFFFSLVQKCFLFCLQWKLKKIFPLTGTTPWKADIVSHLQHKQAAGDKEEITQEGCGVHRFILTLLGPCGMDLPRQSNHPSAPLQYSQKTTAVRILLPPRVVTLPASRTPQDSCRPAR